MIRFVVLCAAFALAACESIPELPTVTEGGPAWDQHQAALGKLKHWQLDGRLAVNNGTEAWNINLRWQQNGDDYQIELSGPFGAGKVQLIGDAHGVLLRDSDQNTFYATSPEELLYQQTGVIMPVTGLRYWVLGLPAPHHVSHPAFDQQGRLAKLQQADWQVAFRRYTQVDAFVLPDKIFIAKIDNSVDVRLVVDAWQLDEAQKPRAGGREMNQLYFRYGSLSLVTHPSYR
jgi:outer membrane lipoprotein LolB